MNDESEPVKEEKADIKSIDDKDKKVKKESPTINKEGETLKA